MTETSLVRVLHSSLLHVELLHRLVLSVQHFLSHPILRFSTALRESLGVTCANMWSFKLVARDTWLLVCLWLVYIVSN